MTTTSESNCRSQAVLKDTFKTRRFQIWSIGLFIVVVSVSILFLGHGAMQPSEPFVSVHFVGTVEWPDGMVASRATYHHNSSLLPHAEMYGYPFQGGNPVDLTCIAVSNRMSFGVEYWLEAFHSGKSHAFYHDVIRAHSETRGFFTGLTEGARLSVSYER